MVITCKISFLYIAKDYVLITRNGKCAHKDEIDSNILTYCESRCPSSNCVPSMILCKTACSDMNDCVGFSFSRDLKTSQFTSCNLYPLLGKPCPDEFMLRNRNEISPTSWKDFKAGYLFPGDKAFCYGKILGMIDYSLSLQF